MNTHPVVHATLVLHAAQAERELALLESQARTVPATQRASSEMLKLTKRIKEKRAIAEAWRTMAAQALESGTEE